MLSYGSSLYQIDQAGKKEPCKFRKMQSFAEEAQEIKFDFQQPDKLIVAVGKTLKYFKTKLIHNQIQLEPHGTFPNKKKLSSVLCTDFNLAGKHLNGTIFADFTGDIMFVQHEAIKEETKQEESKAGEEDLPGAKETQKIITGH